jgi:hypothetical protein
MWRLHGTTILAGIRISTRLGARSTALTAQGRPRIALRTVSRLSAPSSSATQARSPPFKRRNDERALTTMLQSPQLLFVVTSVHVGGLPHIL